MTEVANQEDKNPTRNPAGAAKCSSSWVLGTSPASAIRQKGGGCCGCGVWSRWLRWGWRRSSRWRGHHPPSTIILNAHRANVAIHAIPKLQVRVEFRTNFTQPLPHSYSAYDERITSRFGVPDSASPSVVWPCGL